LLIVYQFNNWNENRYVNDILTKLNIIKPASLIAATEDELKISEKGTVFDSAIGHSSLINKIPITPNNVWSNVSISEVSFNQNSELETTDVGSTEDSTTSIHLSQIGSSQIGFSQVTPTQVGRIQISIPDNSAFQPSAFQGNTKQIGSSQIGFSEVRGQSYNPGEHLRIESTQSQRSFALHQHTEPTTQRQ
jgi:hypothetical protein